ncbi:hypothetical protein A2X44_04835 [candidate division CPR3 bacterium GWF2_35_18]|uniref:Uncharacterized protein n=1 Tax=candidate division CPR3 bacterium GW2011_GWF2_35_18 TaxID=1618350 RepID=A0A0G0E3C0_UNCC3|nr:MAG: hypothetical protein UR67_C0003G0048 [candidate division CPR3 bacterium GW2011_GWF2_35_18]OGB63659.1 MAG: hypothetical protein A2X44_04835 [candidate division CPR3 bacterium GWF2_35_18]OGB65020.1 MAG: hypothetical protein A2250_01205 [candidate division CPR3 bacterium RIFOXYA2_FULL_35_13]OGB79550.1 MAG: hypothetical protein A2296_04495 [candidate division CPR3 bacterium RIFOXYB2_FULL_35_8]
METEVVTLAGYRITVTDNGEKTNRLTRYTWKVYDPSGEPIGRFTANLQSNKLHEFKEVLSTRFEDQPSLLQQYVSLAAAL